VTRPKTPPDILILYEETIPRVAFQSLADAVSAPGLALEVVPLPPRGPQAGLSWLTLTVVSVFIGRSYFDGFLKEAGKEHYQLLKKGIGSLWSLFFGEDRTIRVTVVGTRGKVPKHQEYSVTFSVMAEAGSGLRFKLLLPDDCSAEEFNLATANFLEFFSRYYAGRLDSSTQLRLTSYRVIGGTIPMAYDRANACFVFLDPTAS
jgi:hypothetical protein